MILADQASSCSFVCCNVLPRKLEADIQDAYKIMMMIMFLMMIILMITKMMMIIIIIIMFFALATFEEL